MHSTSNPLRHHPLDHLLGRCLRCRSTAPNSLRTWLSWTSSANECCNVQTLRGWLSFYPSYSAADWTRSQTQTKQFLPLLWMLFARVCAWPAIVVSGTQHQMTPTTCNLRTYLFVFGQPALDSGAANVSCIPVNLASSSVMLSTDRFHSKFNSIDIDARIKNQHESLFQKSSRWNPNFIIG